MKTILQALRGTKPDAPAAAAAPSGPAGQREIRVGDYTHYIGKMPVQGAGEVSMRPLYTDAQMETAVRELRAVLDRDASPETQAALGGDLARQIRTLATSWFQRIDYPEHSLSSTSDHTLVYFDEGSFNTLAKRLTSREACILRPAPKWRYIQPLLPPLEGKSVLELGCSNGFFSFQFAKLGARQVTGVDIVRGAYETAIWSAGVLRPRNVTFLNADFLLDLTIPKHDVVFLSETHNHFLFPFYGLLRLVNLARQTLILDTVTAATAEHGVQLDSGWHDSGQMIYHSFHLTHGMLVDYLNLVGVPPSCITCYRAPDEPYHNLYVIDTSALDDTRAKRGYSEYLRGALELRFVT